MITKAEIVSLKRRSYLEEGMDSLLSILAHNGLSLQFFQSLLVAIGQIPSIYLELFSLACESERETLLITAIICIPRSVHLAIWSKSRDFSSSSSINPSLELALSRLWAAVAIKASSRRIMASQIWRQLIPRMGGLVRPLSTPSSSRLSEVCNKHLNEQINREFSAAYIYFGLFSHFHRPEIALKGMASCFFNDYKEELSHAQQFMEYQAQRGGALELLPINKPELGKIEMPIKAMERALEQEKDLYTHLHGMNKLAESEGDAHFSDFLVDFLKHQLEDISHKTEMATVLKRVGDGVGLHMYDQEILRSLGSKSILNDSSEASESSLP
eukprot:maker-scaffold264_size232020-snap-gene-0.7 protein:Tk03475 transcript:maker-scaffold264_size232020-snap-gene-0.7-mRNA-1 annotation:"ferritin"